MRSTYAGYCTSEHEDYLGEKAPTFVTIDTIEDTYFCRVMFFDDIDTPVLLEYETPVFKFPKELSGESDDPRGFKVSWDLKISEYVIKGRYSQPNDFGTIDLKRINSAV